MLSSAFSGITGLFTSTKAKKTKKKESTDTGPTAAEKRQAASEAQIAFSPNSQYLIANWSNRYPENGKDVLQIWETSSWQMLREVDLGSFVSSYISFSPTGDLLIMNRVDEKRGSNFTSRYSN